MANPATAGPEAADPVAGAQRVEGASWQVACHALLPIYLIRNLGTTQETVLARTDLRVRSGLASWCRPD